MIVVSVCPPVDIAPQFNVKLPAVPRVGEIVWDGITYWEVTRVVYVALAGQDTQVLIKVTR
jgi:hypothetical protein